MWEIKWVQVPNITSDMQPLYVKKWVREVRRYGEVIDEGSQLDEGEDEGSREGEQEGTKSRIQ